jgi:MFS family permease
LAWNRCVSASIWVNILAFTVAARGVLFLLIPAFPNILAFAIIVVVFGAVNSFPMPLIDALLSLRSGPQEQGEVMGINASYLSISNAIGPAIAGLLVSVSYSFPFWDYRRPHHPDRMVCPQPTIAPVPGGRAEILALSPALAA